MGSPPGGQGGQIDAARLAGRPVPVRGHISREPERSSRFLSRSFLFLSSYASSSLPTRGFSRSQPLKSAPSITLQLMTKSSSHTCLCRQRGHKALVEEDAPALYLLHSTRTTEVETNSIAWGLNGSASPLFTFGQSGLHRIAASRASGWFSFFCPVNFSWRRPTPGTAGGSLLAGATPLLSGTPAAFCFALQPATHCS